MLQTLRDCQNRGCLRHFGLQVWRAYHTGPFDGQCSREWSFKQNRGRKAADRAFGEPGENRGRPMDWGTLVRPRNMGTVAVRLDCTTGCRCARRGRSPSAGTGKKETCGWESGKAAFAFPLFHAPRRRSGGNVGISPASGEISKGRWDVWKACRSAFHTFHGPAISTALWLT